MKRLKVLKLFLDFAVGAPYEENPESKSTGAIYIFRGAKNAKQMKMSQRISAHEVATSISSGVLLGFGSSLNGGQDVDSNSYPD